MCWWNAFRQRTAHPSHWPSCWSLPRTATFPGNGCPGVSVLTRTLPFLFLPKLNYEARVVPSVMTEPSPGTLMPVYLLLPKAAVMMDIQGQKAYIIMDRQAVENLRLAFSRKYLNAASVLKLATDAHDFSESIALYNDLFSEKRRCSMIRYQPPFALFADEKMALQFVRPGAVLQSLPALLEHLRCGAPRPRTSISVRKVFCSLYAPGKCSTFRRICAMRRTFPPAGSCSCGCAALRSLTAAPCASWTLPGWRRLRR